MTVEITAHSNVLAVLAEGEFTLEGAKRTFLEVIDSLKKNQVGESAVRRT